MHQQRGADASRAAPQDDAGFAGLEAAVLELTPVPGRAPKESDAVRPVGPEVARVELLGVPHWTLTVQTQVPVGTRLTLFFLIDVSRLQQRTYGAWCHGLGVTPCWAIVCVDPGPDS